MIIGMRTYKWLLVAIGVLACVSGAFAEPLSLTQLMAALSRVQSVESTS